MSNVFKSVQVKLHEGWIDSAYKALSVCYHPESYGDSLTSDIKKKKIFEVLRKGHLSISRYINLDIYLELIPHDTAMQLRTHKFLDCQVTSQRYTGKHLMDGDVEELAEKYFYFRSSGKYNSRSGIYEITPAHYQWAKNQQQESILSYRDMLSLGIDEEVARCVLAQGIRQSMMIHTNLQGLMDVFKVRSLSDSQYEVREVIAQIRDELPDELDDLMIPWYKKYWGKNQATF